MHRVCPHARCVRMAHGVEVRHAMESGSAHGRRMGIESHDIKVTGGKGSKETQETWRVAWRSAAPRYFS